MPHLCQILKETKINEKYEVYDPVDLTRTAPYTKYSRTTVTIFFGKKQIKLNAFKSFLTPEKITTFHECSRFIGIS